MSGIGIDTSRSEKNCTCAGGLPILAELTIAAPIPEQTIASIVASVLASWTFQPLAPSPQLRYNCIRL